MYSIALNGALGLGIIIAFAFSMGDLDFNRIISTPTGFSFIEIFVYASGSIGGGTAMVCPSHLHIF